MGFFGQAPIETVGAYWSSQTQTIGVNKPHEIMQISGEGGAITTAGSGTTARISTLHLREPNITIGTAAVTLASTLYIGNAPTEGTQNYALHIASGAVGVAGSAGTDGQVLTSGGANANAAWEDAAAGGGISVVDQWDVNVAPQGSANPITSWVQTVNDGGAYNIGGQMSQSSGVFTFPSTGTYQVHFNWNYVSASSTPDNQFQIQIQTSLDGGSSWQIAAHTGGGIFSTTAGQTATVLWMFDVTDVSNRLVRFTIANCASGTYGYGSGTGGPSASWATFVRLADSS
jgi:hypothetical protein